MGEPLSRPPAGGDHPREPTFDEDREVTGVHLRGAPRHARPQGAGARPYPGVTLLVVRHGVGGQRVYRLGRKPARRLGWLALGWLLLMLGSGASLRAWLFPSGAPRVLSWANVHAGASAALPLTGWRRMPDARRTPPKPGAGRRRAQALGLGGRSVASQLLRGAVDPRWVREAEQLGQTPNRFLWPVARGWFVRGFGSGTGGYHLAVDVAGEEGSTVRAAADGIVAYADDGVRGFGNLLMLVHGGGFVTMYAHNQTHGVEPGDFVRAGAPIATLGNTGISRGPHVHFELIHDHRNCDPVPLFEPGVRHREAGFDTSRQTSWEDTKPRAVRCERRRRHPNSRWGADGAPDAHATHAEELPTAEPPPASAAPAASSTPRPAQPAAAPASPSVPEVE